MSESKLLKVILMIRIKASRIDKKEKKNEGRANKLNTRLLSSVHPSSTFNFVPLFDNKHGQRGRETEREKL